MTRRLAGQADSVAFTEAMVEQLAAVADESASMTPVGRERERILLLDLAARRVGERQERLLLVVDGLDEDEGAPPASRKPSIASLLPRRPAGNVRVLVTSRPHPGIPTDVPGDHPLRRCVPRVLEPSPFARHIELAATNELMEQLHGGSSRSESSATSPRPGVGSPSPTWPSSPARPSGSLTACSGPSSAGAS